MKIEKHINIKCYGEDGDMIADIKAGPLGLFMYVTSNEVTHDEAKKIRSAIRIAEVEHLKLLEEAELASESEDSK